MKNDESPASTVSFTAHQIQVVRKWAELRSSSAAAAALNVKEQTILTHLRRMRLKLGVHRTVDVYVYMVQNGLL